MISFDKNTGSDDMNIFDIPNKKLSEELTEILHRDKNIRIERIVSDGQFSEKGYWYDQSENEWLVLLQGSASLEFDDSRFPDEYVLKKGDTLFIPAHCRHRVSCTDTVPKCIWLCVFYPADN